MPVALDPNETYSYVICTDRLKAVERRPTLIFHFPTGRDQKKIALLFDESDKAETAEEMIELRCDAVRVILAGWKNFTGRDGNDIPYNPEMLDAVLSDNDLTELNARLLREMSFAEMDKKKLAFSALSNLAVSAKDAPAANASPSPKPNPSTSNASAATAGSGSNANSVTAGESSD